MSSKIEKILEADHSELDVLLERVFAAVDAADAEATFRHLDFFWARLAMHIRAEHVRLFPAVRGIAEGAGDDLGDIPAILDELRHDHDFFMRELARAIKAMRLVFYFGNADETFVTVRRILVDIKARLEAHNRIEEERVYRLADDSRLGRDAIVELMASVQKELDNYPQRFASGAPGN